MPSAFEVARACSSRFFSLFIFLDRDDVSVKFYDGIRIMHTLVDP